MNPKAQYILGAGRMNFRTLQGHGQHALADTGHACNTHARRGAGDDDGLLEVNEQGLA